MLHFFSNYLAGERSPLAGARGILPGEQVILACFLFPCLPPQAVPE